MVRIRRSIVPNSILFCPRLQRKAETADTRHSGLPTHSRSGSGHAPTMKILHLEDSEHDAELICATLREEFPALCVTRVQTSGAFIEGLIEGGWDIILADYSLPGFHGITALKLASQRCSEIPFIFVTGSLGEQRAVETLRNGATDYVVKNRLDLLNQAVTRALRESEDTRAKAAAELRLQNSLHEKELLLQEVHHRVNNNLQIICSLLNMQADAVSNPALASVLRESQGRVHSMAMIHAMLYASSDLKEIDFAAYAESLAREVSSSYGRDASRIVLTFNLEPVCLAIDRAIPCGLILNELLSNSFKYAFPNGNSGEIVVSLSQRGNAIRMAVDDTGVGLPEDHAPRERKSLGMTIVQTLTRQLGGRMEITSDRGSHFVLNMESPAAQARLD
jgi:two-component sensor histidine kinase/CheY-like chemotaxis protein